MSGKVIQKTLFILLLVLLFTSKDGCAQQAISPGITLFPGHLGLKQNTITQIYQDSSGLIWVGTFGGLHKFNGVNFQHIPFPENQKNEAKNVVRSILQCGNKLVFSTEKAVFYYDYKTQLIVELLPNTQTSILLLCYTKNWLYYFDYGKGLVQKYNLVDGKSEVVFQDHLSRGSAFVSHSAKTLFLYQTNGELISISLPSEEVQRQQIKKNLTEIVTVGDEYLGLKTADSLYLADRISLNISFKEALKERVFGATIIHGRTFLLLQSGWGILQKEGTIEYVKASEIGLPQHLADKNTVLFLDSQGNFWVGKDGYGLLQINKLFWQLNKSPSLSFRGIFIRSHFLQENAVWIGTLSGQLYCLKNGETALFTLTHSLSDCAIFSIAELFTDNLLVGTECGLGIFNTAKKSFTPIEFPDGLPMKVNAILKMNDYFIVGGTNSTMLFKLTVKDGKTSISPFLQLEQGVRSLITIDENHLFACLNVGGLQQISTKDGLPKVHAKTLENLLVNNVLKKQNTFLLATSNGVWEIDGQLKSARQIAFKDVYCNAVVIDKLNQIWASANSGIYRVDSSPNGFSQFNEKDGLQSDEFNVRCALKDADGNLFFGGVNGLNIFDPEEIETDKFSPKPYLSRAFNAGEVIEFNAQNKLFLKESSFMLHLVFDVLNYSNSIESQLDMALLSIGSNDTVWIHLNTSRNFYLQGLTAGNYSIIARATNLNGFQSKISAVGTFEILPVFYKRAWFILLVFLFLASIFGIILHQILTRKRQEREAEISQLRALAEMRHHIADDIHDDLGAGLTRITLLADRLSFTHKEAAQELTNLGNLGRDLSQSLRQAIWATKQENEDFIKIIEKMKQLMRDLLLPANINLEFIADENAVDFLLNPLQRQNILLLLKEATNNIVKHSAARKVVVEISVSATQFFIKIVDDGKGFTLQPQSDGNGLKSMKKRAAAIGAILIIDSKVGGPTHISIDIKTT